MKKIVAAIAVFIAAYLVFLIANAPVSIFTQGISLPKNVALTGLSGTVWDGQVERVDANNISIHNIYTKVSPLSLLSLSPEAKITFGGGLNDGPQGQTNISLDGERIVVSDADLELGANLVAPFIQSPVPMEAFGLLSAKVSTLDYGSGQCTSAEGSVTWMNAGVSALGETIELGRFDGDIRCVDQLLTLDIKPANILGLSFSGQLLKNGRITGSGYIEPGRDFPRKLRDVLSFIGKPDNQGRYRVQL